MRYFFKPPPVATDTLCDTPGCGLPGLYKAPKSRENLRAYHHFCLEHVRAYNKKWDYFKDDGEEAIYAHMRDAAVGERPTWPVNKGNFEQKLRKAANFWGAGFDTKQAKPDAPQIRTPERDALKALGLDTGVDFPVVKTRFRALVKKYHPDARPDDPQATERFKTITAAYITLKSFFSNGQR